MCRGLLDRYFKLTERGTSVQTELRAGTVNFLTMCYILLVNPQVLGEAGIRQNDVVVGTAISSALGSLFVGLVANLPFGLAPGLGLSAYLSYGLVRNLGFTWQEALTACLLSGIVTGVLAILRIGDYIMRIIPDAIKMATVVGMGVLLSLIGLTNVDFVIKDPDGLIKMGSLWNTPVILAMIGLVLIATLQHHRIKGGILAGIAFVTLFTWALTHSWPRVIASKPDLQEAFLAADLRLSASKMIPAILAFTVIQIFDVSGVMFGVAKLANLVDDKDEVVGGAWVLLGSSLATILAALTGCSPIIVHLECAAGVKEGGRTGLSSVFTAIWFGIAVFFAPLFSQVPNAATTPVLVFVGATMMDLASRIDWESMYTAIPAYLTIIIMPFTFSIADGIFFGVAFTFILYILTGKFLEDFGTRKQRIVEVARSPINDSIKSPLLERVEEKDDEYSPHSRSILDSTGIGTGLVPILNDGVMFNPPGNPSAEVNVSV
jgi:AGZA family xanthine/uracil permease-like MFS transporter